MLKDSVKISCYNKDDIDELVKLLTVSFGHSFSRERWLWLHHLNLLAPSSVFIAKDNEKIIGVYAVIKKEMVIDNQTVILGRDIDPVVHPDYRGYGIFSKLLRESLPLCKEIAIHANFANPLSKPGFIKKGWNELKIKHLFAPKVPVIKWFYKSVFLKVLSSGIKSDNINVKQVDSIDDFHFSDNLNVSNRPVYVKKDKAYLEWRYCKNPDKKYMIFKASRFDTDLALIFCSENNGRITLLDIVNQSTFKKKEILKSFLLFYVDLPLKMTLVTWDTLCDGADKLMIFGKYGSFLVKNKSTFPDKYIFQRNNWEFGPGESEFL